MVEYVFTLYLPPFCSAAGSAVVIHQLSKRRSQNPFKKLKGLVQSVMFHPTRPFFLVAVRKGLRDGREGGGGDEEVGGSVAVRKGLRDGREGGETRRWVGVSL